MTYQYLCSAKSDETGPKVILQTHLVDICIVLLMAAWTPTAEGFTYRYKNTSRAVPMRESIDAELPFDLPVEDIGVR